MIKKLDFPLNFSDSFSSETVGNTTTWIFNWKGDLKELLPFSNTRPYFLENKEGAQFLGLKRIVPTEKKDHELFSFYLQDFEGESAEHIVCECLIRKIGDNLTIALPVNQSWLPYFDFNKENFNSKKLEIIEERPNFNDWQQGVNSALKMIKENRLNKVVLSRKLSGRWEGSSPYGLFQALTRRQNNIYKATFPYTKEEIFQSFTPESLLKIEDGKLFLEAIAGTRPHHNDKDQNLKWREELLTSDKEGREHQSVVELINSTASELGRVTIGKREVLELQGLQHLKTPITVEINDWSLESLLTLIKTLHPTPAVCGTPTLKAKEFIKITEDTPRGYYAGLFGVITSDYVEISVLIRSLSIKNDTFTAFAGAGIVDGSHAMSEWQETATKLKSFLNLDSTEDQNSWKWENCEAQ
ncbi:MAG: chorismate-binding protein [Bacteriovoracaceae bacterium]|nr:chorismate-binding protein [Bacteriovoracaceae bacterium]